MSEFRIGYPASRIAFPITSRVGLPFVAAAWRLTSSNCCRRSCSSRTSACSTGSSAVIRTISLSTESRDRSSAFSVPIPALVAGRLFTFAVPVAVSGTVPVPAPVAGALVPVPAVGAVPGTGPGAVTGTVPVPVAVSGTVPVPAPVAGRPVASAGPIPVAEVGAGALVPVPEVGAVPVPVAVSGTVPVPAPVAGALVPVPAVGAVPGTGPGAVTGTVPVPVAVSGTVPVPAPVAGALVPVPAPVAGRPVASAGPIPVAEAGADAFVPVPVPAVAAVSGTVPVPEVGAGALVPVPEVGAGAFVPVPVPEVGAGAFVPVPEVGAGAFVPVPEVGAVPVPVAVSGADPGAVPGPGVIGSALAAAPFARITCTCGSGDFGAAPAAISAAAAASRLCVGAFALEVPRTASWWCVSPRERNRRVQRLRPGAGSVSSSAGVDSGVPPYRETRM
ncbi:hypothetical protein ABH932_004577 [Streptacidiphilus sp. MAP5-52]